VGSVIQAIKVTQFFVNETQKLSESTKQVSFFFINPRVVSFDLDELSHESSEANTFNMSFDYDFMVMSSLDSMESLGAEKRVPPVGSAPGDAMPLSESGSSSSGGNNPYASILSSIAGRAVTKLTSELVGSKLRQIPGLGGVADTLSSGLGSKARSIVSQAFARPSTRVFIIRRFD
jgi:hypothetical protein